MLVDIGNNLSDVAGLLLAWKATYLAKAPATANLIYGWRKVLVTASLARLLMLLVAIVAFGWKAFQRILAPKSMKA